MSNPTPHFLVGALDQDCVGQVMEYAQQIGQMLNSQVDCWRTAVDGDELDDLLAKAQIDCDLLFLSEPTQRHLIARLTQRAPHQKILDQHMPASLWLVRQPRWPIRSILLIVCGGEGEEASEEWAMRIAGVCDAQITALVISPAAPGMYREGTRVQTHLELLLTTNAPIGAQLRRILHRLQLAGMEGRLQQHWGTPDEQIEQEIAIGDHDLVVLTSEKGSKWWRWWMGELVEPLLRWIDRPVLIVR